MRVSRVIFCILLPFAVIALAGICLVVYLRFTSVYFGFKNESTKYHADFAEACDSILAHHPLGTNKLARISVTDPSLPKIISDTHPAKIGLAPDYVCVLINQSHIDGLAVVWRSQDEVLSINDGVGPEEIVYVRHR